MKSRYLAPSLLMASLLALSGPAAMASDELAGALIGAGAGAVLGHAIGGHDGAIVGGFLGAAVGASAADDDHRYVPYRHRHAYVVQGPTRYYAPPPPWSGPRYAYPYWRHDRDGWRNERRDHDRDRWREQPRHRYDDARDYRNW